MGVLKYVGLAVLALVVATVFPTSVTLSASEPSMDFRNFNNVVSDLREAAKVIKTYIEEGKYVDIGRYFGLRTYVISSTILNPKICGRDSDGDGLCDNEEKLLGTNPRKFDTDGDGLPDGFEVGTSLYVFCNALLDTGKGPLVILVSRSKDPSRTSIYSVLTVSGNAYPRAGMLFRSVLNPLRRDTDGDGLSDLYEVTQSLRVPYMLLALGCGPDGDVSRIAREFGIKVPSRYDYCYAGGPVLNPFVGVTLRDLKLGKTIYGRLVKKDFSSKRIKYPVWSAGTIFSDVIKAARARWFPNAKGEVFIPPNFDPLLLYVDPTLYDTDGDGLSDYVEVKVLGTETSSIDSDHDGLTDMIEAYLLGTNPYLPDTDGDSLSDLKEFKLGTDPLSKDADGDGLDDAKELKLGTNPKNADSDGDGLNDYVDLRNFGNPLNPDTDGDGLLDSEEYVVRTSLTKVDTDGDGLSDYDELRRYGTSPLNPDTDDDGLSDSKELKLGTNPLVWDSDGDGLSDSSEYKEGTNPLNADSDNDGLSDYDEVMGTTSTAVIYDYVMKEYRVISCNYPTNPLSSDTDGDSLSDYEEVSKCLDPNKQDTDGDGLKDPKDPYPYSSDADGDGLKDPDELRKGTSPFIKDTDGDGIPDPKDPVINRRVSVSAKEVKEVRCELSVEVTSSNSSSIETTVCSGGRRFLVDVANIKLVSSGEFTVSLRIKASLRCGNSRYSLTSMDVISGVGVVGVKRRLVGDGTYEFLIRYSPLGNGYSPTWFAGRDLLVLNNYLRIVAKFTRLGSGEGPRKVITYGYVKLIGKDLRKPVIRHAYVTWSGTSGTLYLDVTRALSVKVVAPKLMVDGANGFKGFKVPRTSYHSIYSKVIRLSIESPSILTRDLITPTKLPSLKLGGGVVTIELSSDVVGKGEDISYYIAQITLSKSYKSKIIYGLLAGYTTIESLVGGVDILIPNVNIKVGKYELPPLEKLKKGIKGLINHVVDRIKSSTVDKLKNWLESKAKEYELRARKHEVDYVVVIQACNNVGCVSRKVVFRGVAYG